jgi:hypothetical protein
MIYDWSSPYPTEITSIFRKQSQVEMGFWICRDREHSDYVTKGLNQVETGQLLGYPECCIEAQQRDHASIEEALIKGSIGILAMILR